MEKSAIRISLCDLIANLSEIQKTLIFAAITLNIITITPITLGAVRWFHFPYLFFLDEWHFLWLTVALTCGLIFSLFFLDNFLIKGLSKIIITNNLDSLAPPLKLVFISSMFCILGISLIELVMILWGVSSALRGLVNIGVGVSCLWSSRFYWVAVLTE